jgi:hypothetical protein
MRQNGDMEIQSLTLEAILDWTRKHAPERQLPFIVQARIAVSPQESYLLNVQPEQPIETISY